MALANPKPARFLTCQSEPFSDGRQVVRCCLINVRMPNEQSQPTSYRRQRSRRSLMSVALIALRACHRARLFRYWPMKDNIWPLKGRSIGYCTNMGNSIIGVVQQSQFDGNRRLSVQPDQIRSGRGISRFCAHLCEDSFTICIW